VQDPTVRYSTKNERVLFFTIEMKIFNCFGWEKSFRALGIKLFIHRLVPNGNSCP